MLRMFKRRSSKDLTVQIGYGDLAAKTNKKATPPSAPVANVVPDLKQSNSSFEPSSRRTSTSQSPHLTTTPPMANTPPSDSGAMPVPASVPVPTTTAEPEPMTKATEKSSVAAGARSSNSSKDNHAASTEPPAKSLVIGEGVVFEGTTEGCATAVVGGKLRGTVKTRRLEITKGGKMEGTAYADVTEIAGMFEGNLAVTNGLKICSTGRFRGDVTFGTIVVENGGKIEGKVNFANCRTPLAEDEPVEYEPEPAESKGEEAEADEPASEPKESTEPTESTEPKEPKESADPAAPAALAVVTPRSEQKDATPVVVESPPSCDSDIVPEAPTPESAPETTQPPEPELLEEPPSKKTPEFPVEAGTPEAAEIHSPE